MKNDTNEGKKVIVSLENISQVPLEIFDTLKNHIESLKKLENLTQTEHNKRIYGKLSLSEREISAKYLGHRIEYLVMDKGHSQDKMLCPIATSGYFTKIINGELSLEKQIEYRKVFGGRENIDLFDWQY
jgi:hypothetical protein